MAGVNKVILLGNLGDKPEIKYTSDGKAIANLSVATSKTWVDKNSGQKVDKTEWHRVVLFGKRAEIADKYCEKGTKVYIEGELTTHKYQDKNTGEDKYSTQIVVDSFNGSFQMVSGKKSSAAATDDAKPSEQGGTEQGGTEQGG
jgi:single-strand DNA-binding protein